MTDPAAQSIAALRRAQDELAALVGTLTPEQLTTPSACTEWSVADVLSHLGSGAENNRRTLLAGRADMAANQAVWDRWNTMTPQDKAINCVSFGEQLVQAFESQDEGARQHRTIDLGFLPMPVDIAFCADLRLSEMALHRWDVEVPFDASATISDYLVPIVLDRLPLFAGFFAKPIGRALRIGIRALAPDRDYVLELTTEGGSLSEGASGDVDASMSLPAEAFVRLTSGRLAPKHTPAGVEVRGAVSLDDLRTVFPGY
jgi:uncharacterized protein (TIGR03083 family)